MFAKHEMISFDDFQLDLIMEAVGTPNVDDMRFACEAAKSYILRKAPKRSEVNAQVLECLSSADYCKEDAVQLLRMLLVFNPVRTELVI